MSYLYVKAFSYTCCIDDCPACIAARVPDNPAGPPGVIESKAFDVSIDEFLDKLVSPIPLLNKAFSPALLLFSFGKGNGKLDINFEVDMVFGALVFKEDDIGGIAKVALEDFLFLSINEKGDMDFGGGDEGGEYC